MPRSIYEASSRPQFLMGFFIGLCLSTMALQMTVYHGLLKFPSLSLSGRQVPPSVEGGGPIGLEEQFPDHGVYNLGHKLQFADDEGVSGRRYDSHVVRYTRDDDASNGDRVGVDPFDGLPGGELAVGKEEPFSVDGGSAAKSPIYVGLLTSRERLTDQTAVVSMTWGAELPSVQFFYDTGDSAYRRVRRDHLPELIALPEISPKETFGPKHAAEALRYVCGQYSDRFHWFIFASDATYIHTSGLLRILDRLLPSEDFILGMRDSAHDGECSAASGMIISSKALSRLCPRLDRCTQQHGWEGPWEMCLALQCISSKKIAPDFHVTGGGRVVDAARLVAEAESLPRLSEQTVFVGPLDPAQDFYKLHLYFTRMKIARTQTEMHRLSQELSRTRRSVRPKRDRSSAAAVQVESSGGVFGPEALLNKTSEPLYQFIDGTGHLYLDTCKVRKQDVGKEDTSPYRAALALAKGVSSSELEPFAYKVTKPNVGVEYQFYFTEHTTTTTTLTGGRRRPRREKVRQVTVLHPYGSLEMEAKEVQALRTVHFVVPTTGDREILDRLLLNYERVCLAAGRVDADRCSLLIVVFRKAKGSRRGGGGDEVGGNEVQQKLSLLQERFSAMRAHVTEVVGESLTIARTIQMAGSAYEDNDLLAFLPADVSFNEDFLFRCQINTLTQKRAYFPVLFQRYENAPVRFPPADDLIRPNEGFWANADFGAFCAYNEDVQLFDNLPGSSFDLHNMFKASETMGVFRAPDPGLMRDWRKNVCSMSNLLEKNECMKELRYINMQ